jgi:hypothetical protein
MASAVHYGSQVLSTPLIAALHPLGMHRIEVSVPRVDGSQHVFADPAARIRQGFEHVRPSKEEAALPFEQVARVQAEGWMFRLATARQLGVHIRHPYAA